MKERFVIEGLGGEKKLTGEIVVGGAKNSITKIIPATILFEDEVCIDNVPNIEDTHRMIEILRASGAAVTEEGKSLVVSQPSQWNPILDKNIAERLRASVVFTGPMLARTGSVAFPFPGGCVL